MCFGLPAVLWGQVPYIPSTYLLKKSGYQLQGSGEIFKTTKHIDRNGKKTSLADGESFSRTQAEIGGFYGATNNFQLGVGARLRQHKSQLIFNNQTIDGSSQGLQSIFINGKYAFLPVGQWQYTLEGMYRHTPYTNSEVTASTLEDLILGDDGHEYSVGMGATYAFHSNNFLTFVVGYRKPGQDISDEITWQAEGALVWKYLALVAGVDGISSMNNDPFEDDPTQKPAYNTGGSNLYNALNREFIAPYAGINIGLGQTWRVEFRGSQVVSGKSTDMGSSFSVLLATRLDPNKGKSVDQRFKSYDIEANINKVSPKKEYVVIDKGLADNISKGMKFDFYEFDYVGGNILIASGSVVQVKSGSSIVKITQRFNQKKDIKEGLVGRSRIR